MRSRETCPVQPLLRLSLVGSQPMRTLLGKGGSTVGCACAAGKPALSSRYSGCHWSAHSQWGHCYTAKKIIGNRLSRLKSASLLMQNIISNIGIFHPTHSVLFYIVYRKKCFPAMPMGENPWYPMENSTPRLCWEIPTINRKILMPG